VTIDGVAKPDLELRADDDARRLERAAREEFQFIWRSLRRLGVRPDDAVDDAAQRVFEIAARKRTLLTPGCERAFLFKTALHVAQEVRRNARRSRARFDAELMASELADPKPDPEESAEQARLRRLLDEVLEQMPLELRAVFVLFELEELTSLEIAPLLGIPPGTVASRLRRARALFRDEVQRSSQRAQAGARR
jgi:RNA polymerase sigma-70 factor, ECF subfamily